MKCKCNSRINKYSKNKAAYINRGLYLTKLKAGGLNWKSAKIPNFNPKRRRFCVLKKKRKRPGDASPGHCSSSSLWSCPSSSFPGAFDASFGPQIRQRVHQHVHLKLIYPREWSGQAEKHRNGSFIGLKWPPRAVCSLGLPNLAVRGAHFEPTAWIPQVESRAETFSPLKTRLPFFHPYK